MEMFPHKKRSLQVSKNRQTVTHCKGIIGMPNSKLTDALANYIANNTIGFAIIIFVFPLISETVLGWQVFLGIISKQSSIDAVMRTSASILVERQWRTHWNTCLKKVCNVFGLDSLHKHQKDSFKYVVKEKKDVFVNLPTGFRKQLIYQALPLVYLCLQSYDEKNIIVVISQLGSLRKDQGLRLIINSLGNIQSSLDHLSNGLETRNGEKMSELYRKSVRAGAVCKAQAICRW